MRLFSSHVIETATVEPARPLGGFSGDHHGEALFGAPNRLHLKGFY
jgi:hypothetical protein